jgi:muconate cycloisomerase
MNFSFQQLALKKRYPLRISRGETTGSVNLFVSVESAGVVGLGEAAPDATADIGTAASCQREIEAFLEATGPMTLNPHDAWQVARDAGLSSYSWAAVDIALWDLLARQAGLPLFRLLGLPLRAVPTSVTIGIVPIEVARERVPEILTRTGARYLKIKLGNPAGIDADKAMFEAVRESA